MDDSHNPFRLNSMLEKTEEPAPHPESIVGGWEMLSFEKALPPLEEGMPPPSVETLACILHHCRRERNLAYAMRLHAYMRKSGLDAHRSLGNLLVSMLVEVGSMSDAQQVFDRLVHRNECSWNSLITGYTKCGELQHALFFYEKMREYSVHSSTHTFVALLKACAKENDVQRGREIHADIARKELEGDLFVGSTLVDMYAKCGLLAKAQELFDKLPARDVVSWNALISGYAKHGHGEEALTCFEQMQAHGIYPNTVTFVCSLKACGNIGAADKGQELHAEIARKGLFERHGFVGNALVDMYAKCGFLAKAQEVFDKLLVRDPISWNALIAGYTKHGHAEEALNCFEQMQLDGVSPNTSTYVCILKACSSIRAADKGREIHAAIDSNGLLERDPVVGNALVDMYANCGFLEKAQEVFDKLSARDVVSWTALITKYAKYGRCEEALNCFEEMQREGVSPNAVTFVCSLTACSTIGAIEKGQEIHTKITRQGLLESELAVGNALVDMYANCGFLAKAQEVFDELPQRDVVSWTALIAGYSKHDNGEEALNCFEQMQLEGVSPDVVTFVCTLKACGSIGAADKGIKIHDEIARKGLLEGDLVVGNALIDMYANCGLLSEAQEMLDELPVQDLVSWTALIAGYVKHGFDEEALNCFEQMQLKSISPDAVTLVYSLQACGNIGATDKGQEIHAEIVRKGSLKSDLVVGNALVDMYAKCGLLAKAQEVFDMLQFRDEVSWNALIAGYAQLGETENVYHILDRMGGESKKPNLVTLVSVLNACRHAGLVDKAQMYFEAMIKDHGITPSLEHYTCMIDLLGRAGQLDTAVARIKGMPFHPNLVVWHTVLGACRKWGNVELGRWAFEDALQLDEKDAAAYVCMSNIYADADMQEDVKKVEALRVKKAGVWEFKT